MRKYIIGIDPGKKGSIATMDISNHSIIKVVKMPDTPVDLLELLDSLPNEECITYLEQVHEQPKQSGMFEFGRNYGMIETALAALKMPHYKITPQKWQKGFALRKPTTTDKQKAYQERKRILKAKAQEIFPGIKVTLDNSDGLLIAEYGYSMEKRFCNNG